MARKADYEYKQYRLTWKGDEACVTFDEAGGRRRIGLGVRGKENAKAATTALVAWVQKREQQAAAVSFTIADGWKLYYADRETACKVMRAFDDHWKFLEPSFARVNVLELTEAMCQEAAVQWDTQGLARWTIYGHLNQLSTLVKWLADRNHIALRPKVWVPSQPEVAVNHALTKDQLLALIGETRAFPHLYLFVMLMLSTGGRPTAVLELTWDRVDFNRNQIDLRKRDAAKKPILSKAFKKGRAVVPMNATIRALLSELWPSRTSNESHVIMLNGQPVGSITRSFNKAATRAKLPDWATPHTIRHSVATLMEQQGVPVEDIAKFLGHSDPKVTTQIYIEASGKSLVDAAAHMDLSAPTRNAD